MKNTVYTIVSGGKINGVYTNIKELHKAIMKFNAGISCHNKVLTYAQLNTLKNKDHNKNLYFSYTIENNEFCGTGDIQIREVLLNR